MNIIFSIGTINPGGAPTIPFGGHTAFVGGLIRGTIQFLIVASFIVALLWTIFAGFRFVTSGGDPKSVSSAWSQIYWGLIGMVIVMGSFAIIKLVEIFFNVSVISDGAFVIPNR